MWSGVVALVLPGTLQGWTLRTSRLEPGGWAGEVDLGKARAKKTGARKNKERDFSKRDFCAQVAKKLDPNSNQVFL